MSREAVRRSKAPAGPTQLARVAREEGPRTGDPPQSATTHPGSLDAGSLWQLQRSLGNRAVTAMLSAAPPVPPRVAIIRRNLDDDISPSYVSSGKEESSDDKNQSLVHRGLVETEMVEGKKYVRAYQTVYASVQPGSSWKDTHQVESDDPSQRTIKFLGKGDTWINFGNPLRALHYVRTYYAQAPGKREEELSKLPKDGAEEELRQKQEQVNAYHGRPVVRSFLVPYDTYLELTGGAISESQRAKLGSHNLNVDKSKASDQYQIMEDDVKKLTATALAGSLVSYVLDDLVSEYEKASYHGKVEGIAKLSEKLGLPHVFDSLTIPMEGTEVPSSAKQAARASELGELFDLSFLMEKKEDNPRYAKVPMDRAAYMDLYLRHEDRISELAKKYLNTDTLPPTKNERNELRKKLASAGDAALIPSLIEQNYYEGTAAMHGKTADGSPMTTYGKKLTFEKILLEPLVKEKIVKLTAEQIEERKREAEERKKTKSEEPAEEEGDVTPFADLFDA